MPKKDTPTITVAPRAEAHYDLDAILKKRMENPFGAGTTEVPLREPEKWSTYIANGDLHPSRLYEMTYKKGWEPVREEDLAIGVTAASIGFQVSETGALCRGPRGQEVVYKQPKEVRQAIAMRKTEINKKGMGTPAKVKADLASAAGGAHGDEAGSFVEKHIVVTGSDREGPLGAA